MVKETPANPPAPNKSHALIIKEYVAVNADLVEARREVDRLKKLLRLARDQARQGLAYKPLHDGTCEPLRVQLRWIILTTTTGGIGEPGQVDAPMPADDPRRPAPPDVQGPALESGDGKIRP